MRPHCVEHVLTFHRPGHRARIMIFIYTHAEDSSGDLFYNTTPQAGSLPDVRAEFVRACLWLTLQQWFDAMFGPAVKALADFREVSMAFVCCGSIYSSPGNFATLKGLCETYVLI